jgi:hypothetical protein
VSFLKRTAALWPYVLIVISLVGLAYTSGCLPLDFRQETLSAGVSAAVSTSEPAGLVSGIQALLEPVS